MLQWTAAKEAEERATASAPAGTPPAAVEPISKRAKECSETPVAAPFQSPTSDPLAEQHSCAAAASTTDVMTYSTAAGAATVDPDVNPSLLSANPAAPLAAEVTGTLLYAKVSN